MTDKDCSMESCSRQAEWLGVEVEHEETGEKKTGDLCDVHYEKLLAYNRGEEVEWSE